MLTTRLARREKGEQRVADRGHPRREGGRRLAPSSTRTLSSKTATLGLVLRE
jgi:hypothetical protein